ncbi:MAG: hypothetical protein AAFY91_18450, partial [Bacteroidota bacterium]
MKRGYILTFPAVTAVSLLSGAGLVSSRPQLLNRYYIPNNYVGNVRIAYSVPGAPALEAYDERHRIVPVPRSGLVETSSPANYGRWVETCDGRLGNQYHYVDDDENPVRQLSKRPCQNYEITGESTGTNHTASFFVGTREEGLGNNHCPGGERQPDGSVFWPDLPFDPTFDDDLQEFYIPDQYVGYVKIMYDQSDRYPKLPTDLESGKRLLQIPASGILRTSSSPLRERNRNCNQKRKNYFYDSELPREERRLIEDQTIWNPEYSAIGGISVMT